MKKNARNHPPLENQGKHFPITRAPSAAENFLPTGIRKQKIHVAQYHYHLDELGPPALEIARISQQPVHDHHRGQGVGAFGPNAGVKIDAAQFGSPVGSRDSVGCRGDGGEGHGARGHREWSRCAVALHAPIAAIERASVKLGIVLGGRCT